MKLTKEQFIQKMAEEASKIEIELNKQQLEKLYMYKEMLLEWNEKINLTAILDDEEIISKHFIDSLYAVKFIPEGKRVIDVGTGAGFPGIVLAIYFNGKIELTLFDALNKRIEFLNKVINELDLKNIIAIHGRAEEFAKRENYRQQYDIVISRAVAVLNVLLELTSPFVKINGICLYMKADKTKEELEKSSNAEIQLGIKYIDTYNYKITVENEEFKHTIIKYLKINNTKEKYPRIFGKIKKSPL